MLSEFDKAMLALNLCSAAIIFYRGVFNAINAMTKHTYFPIRISWVLIATGALAVMLGPAFELYMVSPLNTILYGGIALFVFSDRRFTRSQS